MMWRKTGFALLAILALTGLAFWLPLDVPYGMDFSMLYAADAGLCHGVGLYDHAGQQSVLAALQGVHETDFVLPFFVYPPWYAWTTFYLGWMPPAAAARLWLFLSLGMILAGGWLLNDGLDARQRAVRLLWAVLWLPTLGLLVVGQYVPPLLLGLGAFTFGWRRRKPWLTALGLALLTFKPHVGALPLLAGLIVLWAARQTDFSRRALGRLGVALAVLTGVSFLVQPDWIAGYWQALTMFRGQSTFGLCEQCSSVGVVLARALTGLPRMDAALGLSAGLGVLAVGGLIWRRAWRWSAERLIVAAVLVGLLMNPYLMNYDYLLLLVPLWLYRRPLWQTGLILLLPWLALPFGRLALSPVLVLLAFWFLGEVLRDDPA